MREAQLHLTVTKNRALPSDKDSSYEGAFTLRRRRAALSRALDPSGRGRIAWDAMQLLAVRPSL